MPTDDFYTPTDVDTLRMENELLAFEVRFLKARFSEPERFRAQLEEMRPQLEEAKAQLKETTAQLEDARAQLEAAGPQLEEARNTAARLEGAETDLVLLLRRLGESPAGRLFRRKPAFRDLERRYLGNDA